MINFAESVARFMRENGHLDQNEETVKLVRQIGIPPAQKVLRLRLMMEELGELSEAIHEHDIVEIADGLADLIYVVVGTALAYHLPIDEIFEEVHASNMSKTLGNAADKKYAHEKFGKGSCYKPPNLRPILAKYGFALPVVK